MRFRPTLLSLSLFAAVLFGLPQVAHAGYVTSTYTFTGTCSDCVGVGVGTLTLANYTPGDTFTLFNFVDFTYTSSIFTTPYEISSSDLMYFSGSIGSADGQYNVFASDSGNQSLFTSSGGYWCVGDGCGADYGMSHAWSAGSAAPPAVPEPATASLVGLGLAGLGVVRRRFRA